MSKQRVYHGEQFSIMKVKGEWRLGIDRDTGTFYEHGPLVAVADLSAEDVQALKKLLELS